ncbi:MAG: hypothetical protein Q7V88_09180 [Actinomycetota bacterium]|nr:hypothetical protein [Actinomycetota bacterium]
MLRKPENKAADTPEDDTRDRGAEMYPADDGWRPVFDRFGRRYGFYHDSHGLKDDPDVPRFFQPSPDPISLAVFASDEVIKAKAAADAERLEVEAKRAEWEQAIAREATLSVFVQSARMIERPPGSSKYLYLFPDGTELTPDDLRARRHRLNDATTDAWRDYERAEAEFARINADHHQATMRVRDRLVAQPAGRKSR